MTYEKPTHPYLAGHYLSCGEGWFHIINVLCAQLEDQVTNHGAPTPIVRDVKEKYGTLRFYADDCNEVQDALIYMAEELSGVTCEVCGKPGRRRAQYETETRCDEHVTPPRDIDLLYEQSRS